MDKVIKDGKVAVLYSPNYGAGWYTWNDTIPFKKELVFHPQLVQKVLDGKADDITEEFLKKIFGENAEDCYTGGVSDLEIAWIPEGTRFKIEEFDGYESVVVLDNNPDVFTA